MGCATLASLRLRTSKPARTVSEANEHESIQLALQKPDSQLVGVTDTYRNRRGAPVSEVGARQYGGSSA